MTGEWTQGATGRISGGFLCPLPGVYVLDHLVAGQPFGLKEASMFWQLQLGAVIGRRANEAVTMSSRDWRAMEAQFEIKAERAWPNPEPSKRAKNTRDHVLTQFWQTFVPCSPTLWQ